MADRQQTTTFPAPPPFYLHFTDENVRRAAELKHQRQQAGQDAADPAADETLLFLEPPEIPQGGRWRAFGVEHELNALEPDLHASGIEQLFPDDSSVKLVPQPYLQSMARSLLTTFLSMTGTLAQNPTLYAKKVEDLRTIVVNMHYLINQYRPHQARESLITMMEDRLDSMRLEIDSIHKAKERLTALASRLQESSNDAEAIMSPSGPSTGLKAVSQQASDLDRLWDIIDATPGRADDDEKPALDPD